MNGVPQITQIFFDCYQWHPRNLRETTTAAPSTRNPYYTGYDNQSAKAR
jgi:hypothetical protein